MKYFNYPKLLDPPVKRAAYSDRTAWLLAAMSNLAYIKFEENSEKEEELKAGLKEANFVLIKSFSNEGTQAFLAKKDIDKILVLSFRGTEKEDFRDIWSDIDVRFYKGEDGSKIHNGFLQAFKKVEEQINAELKNYGDYSFYITGHSLGGALALIAAKAFDTDNLAACYTYGSPMVGNEEFGRKIKPPIYRIVNALDPVPCLPPSYFFYFVCFIFKHFKNTKWYDFFKNCKEFTHQGDARYLVNCGTDYKQANLLYGYAEIKRIAWLLLSIAQTRRVDVEDHDLDVYCEKLGEYGLTRN